MTTKKEDIYSKAKLGGGIGFGKRPAIIVIDFQKGFTLPESPAGGDMTEAVKISRKIVEAGREKNVKIFYTRVGYNKDGSDLGAFGHKAPILRDFTRDHWYYEFDERLDIREQDICLEKHWPSAFFGTHLNPMLVAMNIDTIILCGCTTAGCVYATSIDGCSYGYRTIAAADGITDRAQETHDFFLWNMGQKYADVMSSEEIIDEFKNLEKLSYGLLY